MKILFSITYYSPYVSGLTIYVKRVAEELAKRGHEVTVLCMGHDKNLPEKEIINNVNVIRANPLFRINKGFLSVDWIIKSRREADVVVVNLPQAEGWITALMAKKVIAIYHCEINLKNKIVQKVLEICNLITLQRADTIVTYTEDYGKSCRLLKGLEYKTKYIYPPVPMPKGSLKLKKPKGEIWIGVAARLAEEKGIEYLLEAIPLLRLKIQDSRFKVVVAGPMEPVGEEEYKNKIMKLVEKYKDRVKFLGTIDPNEMGGFYKAIDVLVLPSVNSTEAFGMVQVEAMMVGVPVVASDLPGVRVPIQVTGMGKLVKQRNSRELANTIKWAIENKPNLKELVNKARSEFALTNTIDQLEQLMINLNAKGGANLAAMTLP
ncbi:MAG: putative glycosyltransferase [Microgenomates group bacterium Gr01-1014_16]|nr:MAG: putative glycosyltransferase [Microgenomates group bacterium Gr01-1014_16]